MKNQVLLRQVTAEWDAKARIYLESARYWEITQLRAKEKGDIEEEKRASERYNAVMTQAKHAHAKLRQCLELRSSL
jgi:hypothetical protein